MADGGESNKQALSVFLSSSWACWELSSVKGQLHWGQLMSLIPNWEDYFTLKASSSWIGEFPVGVTEQRGWRNKGHIFFPPHYFKHHPPTDMNTAPIFPTLTLIWRCRDWGFVLKTFTYELIFWSEIITVFKQVFQTLYRQGECLENLFENSYYFCYSVWLGNSLKYYLLHVPMLLWL